jgi:hypothetical protein
MLHGQAKTKAPSTITAHTILSFFQHKYMHLCMRASIMIIFHGINFHTFLYWYIIINNISLRIAIVSCASFVPSSSFAFTFSSSVMTAPPSPPPTLDHAFFSTNRLSLNMLTNEHASMSSTVASTTTTTTNVAVVVVGNIPSISRPLGTLPLGTSSEQLTRGMRQFLMPVLPAEAAETTTAVAPPTNDEIKLLREALGAIYGERNPEKAKDLLTRAISAWERQPPDERAALYRVRGDCFMVC